MTVEAAQKEDPELAWSAASATAQIGETNTFPTLTNPHSVTVSYSSSDNEKATIDATTGEITLVAAGETTISAVFAGNDTYEEQTVTYTLTVQAAPTTYTFKIDEEDNLFTVGSYEEGDNVQYTFDHALEQDQPGMWHWEYTMSPASLVDYNFSPGTPAWTDNNDPENPVEWPEEPAWITFTMPADDVLYTITRVHEEPPVPESPELSWSEDTCSAVLDADDNVYPVLSNPYGVSPLYFSSDDENVATINENGEITLVETGETTINATFDGDSVYESQTVSYTLSVIL